NTKQMLFEMMGKVNPDFKKPQLNEDVQDKKEKLNEELGEEYYDVIIQANGTENIEREGLNSAEADDVVTDLIQTYNDAGWDYDDIYTRQSESTPQQAANKQNKRIKDTYNSNKYSMGDGDDGLWENKRRKEKKLNEDLQDKKENKK
ncbi:MAG: hypothetical protein DRI95_08240, partial [Bacteroidetes bacterium]